MRRRSLPRAVPSVSGETANESGPRLSQDDDDDDGNDDDDDVGAAGCPIPSAPHEFFRGCPTPDNGVFRGVLYE